MIELRVCRDCGAAKPQTNFTLLHNTKRGRSYFSSYCNPCHQMRTKTWLKANPERRLAAEQRWRKDNLEKERAYSRSWQSRNRHRVQMTNKATSAVYLAIKAGKLVRPTTCEQCGNGGRIQAAHSDYSQPLAVRWLCIPCHVRWDKEQPKTRCIA